MISAVESHLGPGRPSFYTNPHMPHSPLHLQPSTSVQIPPPIASPSQTGLPNFGGNNNVAEQFARPHPKTRINGMPNVRNNGMTSPRSKYATEQNGPVNLAVMPNPASSPHAISPNVSPKDDRLIPMDQSVSQQQQQAKDSLIESFNNSRLPYAASNAAALANYYNPYSFHRYPLPYAPPPHHSLGRPLRYEPYSYLPSVPYASQSSPQSTGLGPLPISQQNGHAKVSHATLPSLLPPLNATNPLIAPPPPPPPSSSSSLQQTQQQIQHKEMYKESSKIMSHNTNKSPNHSPQHNNNNNNVGFKVPSGKEGSLKHRILTRPYDKDGKPQRSPPGITNGMPLNRNNNNNNNVNNNNNDTSNNNMHFTKGSIIELATGELKRVEDMRTEDFILSAKNSSKLELQDSTVVKITPSSNQVIVITFSLNKNQNQVDMEANVEHPFFVYGKGWASCNPDGTYQQYGLKCQRLQVGDICISYKSRKNESQSPPPPQKYDMPYNNNSDLPQNLSRRAAETHTIPATNTISSARAAPSSLEMNQHAMMSSSLPYTNHMLDLQRSKFGIPQIIEPASQQRPLSHESTSLQERYASYLASSMAAHNNPDMPMSMVLPHKTVNQLMTDDANEASSKKRRWSAPSNFEDDNEEARNALLRGKYSH
ncbi:ataxin-1 [Culicoides brevitarsis]|uniref:ataxin-1 n=1 Tax=Culicoides brevitarsis TaxID=469753 RepID=UPI00307BECDB